jgi:hypothetical protein
VLEVEAPELRHALALLVARVEEVEQGDAGSGPGALDSCPAAVALEAPGERGVVEAERPGLSSGEQLRQLDPGARERVALEAEHQLEVAEAEGCRRWRVGPGRRDVAGRGVGVAPVVDRGGDLDETPPGHPGVAGRGLGLGVAGEGLHGAQVVTPIERLGEGRVAELVRGDVREPGRVRDPLRPLPDRRRVDVVPAGPGEEGPRGLRVSCQLGAEHRVDRHRRGHVALAGDGHPAERRPVLPGGEVLPAERRELLPAERRVEPDQDREAHPVAPGGCGRLERSGLALGERPAAHPGLLRRPDRPERRVTAPEHLPGGPERPPELGQPGVRSGEVGRHRPQLGRGDALEVAPHLGERPLDPGEDALVDVDGAGREPERGERLRLDARACQLRGGRPARLRACGPEAKRRRLARPPEQLPRVAEREGQLPRERRAAREHPRSEHEVRPRAVGEGVAALDEVLLEAGECEAVAPGAPIGEASLGERLRAHTRAERRPPGRLRRRPVARIACAAHGEPPPRAGPGEVGASPGPLSVGGGYTSGVTPAGGVRQCSSSDARPRRIV